MDTNAQTMRVHAVPSNIESVSVGHSRLHSTVSLSDAVVDERSASPPVAQNISAKRNRSIPSHPKFENTPRMLHKMFRAAWLSLPSNQFDSSDSDADNFVMAAKKPVGSAFAAVASDKL